VAVAGPRLGAHSEHAAQSAERTMKRRYCMGAVVPPVPRIDGLVIGRSAYVITIVAAR